MVATKKPMSITPHTMEDFVDKVTLKKSWHGITIDRVYYHGKVIGILGANWELFDNELLDYSPNYDDFNFSFLSNKGSNIVNVRFTDLTFLLKDPSFLKQFD